MKVIKSKPLLIGCETIIREAMPFMDQPVVTERIEAELHSNGPRLKKALQVAVTKADGKFNPIIIGYGLCSNGVIGLKAHKSTLIIPRVEDCIALMLGSTQIYQMMLKKNPGTFFLSRGWVESGITPLNELQTMTERYDEDRAKFVQKKIFQHYKHLIYVDTDYTSLPSHERIAKETATELELSYKKIQGTSKLLKALYAGPWDHRFIVCKPGTAISLSDFSNHDTSIQNPVL